MANLFNGIYVVAAVLFLFGAAVFVHELGHYLVARWCKMKVEAFAIGFGPKIFAWTKNGIEYSWRWIPAGGFVKLPQMMTSDALEGKSADEKVPPASPWAKILVAIAGPFMNLVFAFVIAAVIYRVGLPIAVNPSVIGYVEPDSPEFRDGIREGDRIVIVNGKLVKSWQDVQMVTALARTNVLPVVTDRNGVRSTNLLSAKANEVIGLKMLNLDPKDHPVVVKVVAGSPAETAGLKENDRFVSFGGIPIVGQEQLIEMIKKRGGQPTEVQVERGNQKLALQVTPRIIDKEKKTGQIGVELTGSSTLVYQVMKPGPTPWAQVSDVLDKTISTFSALLHSKQTGVGAKDLAGPVGIFAMLAIQVNQDYRLALNFLVLLNINLAFLNLLPIPVLDGGHILLSLVEKIRRRPISARVQEYATTAFALLLISFMLYVTFFDIKRAPLFRSMFKKDTQIEEVDGAGEGQAPRR